MGQATQLSQSGQGVALELNPYKKVLTTLAQYRSMPFLELNAVCDIGDARLESIIKHLEREKVVKVSNPGNILEEIVTLKKEIDEANLDNIINHLEGQSAVETSNSDNILEQVATLK